MSTASQLMAALQPPVLNVHTPRSSFAIVFSSMSDMTYIRSLNPSYFRPDTDDTLQSLFDKLSKKTLSEFQGQRVKSGWAKYSWNGSIWNLDDGEAFPVFIFAMYMLTTDVFIQSQTTPSSSGGRNLQLLTAIRGPCCTFAIPTSLCPRRQNIRTCHFTCSSRNLRLLHLGDTPKDQRLRRSKVWNQRMTRRSSRRTSRDSTMRMVCALLRAI